MNLLAGIEEFIDSEKLFSTKERVLIAVSGGVDSMVLSDLLCKLGYDLSIAHVNYQLRGSASDLDEELVKNISSKLSIPFFSRRFATSNYAKDEGLSIQMAARQIRYQWFDELVRDHGFQRIATAHHLNDMLETLLLNITKGTGIAGLHGILAKRGNLVRPLLFAKKDEILSYAIENKLEWREDQSNDSLYYQRNLIRHQVIPVLKQINPDIESTTQTTVEILREVETQYNKVLNTLQKELMIGGSHDISIPKSRLTEMDPTLFAALIKDYGFNLSQAKNILKQAFRHTGAIFNTHSHTLNIDRDQIIITPNSDRPESVPISADVRGEIDIGIDTWHVQEVPAKKYQITESPNCAAFDLEKLVFPLEVRIWQSGDRFRPLGMDNYKKISDFLIDSKVPRNHKSRLKVMTSNSEVVWVVGHRIDDRYKLTESTNTVLEIRIE